MHTRRGRGPTYFTDDKRAHKPSIRATCNAMSASRSCRSKYTHEPRKNLGSACFLGYRLPHTDGLRVPGNGTGSLPEPVRFCHVLALLAGTKVQRLPVLSISFDSGSAPADVLEEGVGVFVFFACVQSKGSASCFRDAQMERFRDSEVPVWRGLLPCHSTPVCEGRPASPRIPRFRMYARAYLYICPGTGA
jgi:hypothetical protein